MSSRYCCSEAQRTEVPPLLSTSVGCLAAGVKGLGFSVIKMRSFGGHRSLVPPLCSTSLESLRIQKNGYVFSFASKTEQHQPDMKDRAFIGAETSGATLIEYFG